MTHLLLAPPLAFLPLLRCAGAARYTQPRSLHASATRATLTM